MSLFKTWKYKINALALTLCAGCAASTVMLEDDYEIAAAAAAADAATNVTGNLPVPVNANSLPFEAIDYIDAANKIKKLLVAMPLNSNDRTSFDNSKAGLANAISSWQATDAYQQILLRFFADNFQQSQLAGNGGDKLTQNKRESFARTVLYMIQQNRPFTEVFTTKTYMMTTALMYDYTFSDTNYPSEAGGTTNQWVLDDPKWKFTIEKSAGPISLAETADRKSPNYMVLYAPKLGQGFGDNPPPVCRTIDPFVFGNLNFFGRIQIGAAHVNTMMRGGGFTYFYPAEYRADTVLCSHSSIGPDQIQDSDYKDWHLVTVQPVTKDNPQTIYFNLPEFRSGSKSLYLYREHAGFMTTPSFMQQWPTNKSNSFRATVNQALIVGLGGGVGDDRITPMPQTPAVDAAHSAEPGCMNCHQDLDPLRQFYMQRYNIYSGRQRDANTIAIPAKFGYGGVTADGQGLTDFARMLAEHPLMPLAWTVKVCTWASGAPCLESDPEVQRISQVFKNSNYNFNALVKEVMLSPIITYEAPTKTTDTYGQISNLARRNQLCDALAAVLGMGEICGRDAVQTANNYSIPALASSIPSDQYGRGVNTPLFVVDPDLVLASTLENFCSAVADQVATVKPAVAIAQQDPNTAVPQLVHSLMGIGAPDDVEPMSILNQHWRDILAASKGPVVAWKSAFVLACMSPSVIASGQ